MNVFQCPQLKAWLKELSIDQGEKTRSLFKRIYQMNQIEMDASDRLRSLELLCFAFIPVQQFLYSRLTPNGFPLDDKSQKIGQLLLDFVRQFLTGYLLVLDSLLLENKPLTPSSDLALTIQRSIRNLGAVFLVYYRFALKEPVTIWQDMNKLFQLAANAKILTAKVKDSALLHLDSTTIEQTYKNIAILHIVDPYRLTSDEIFDLHHLLEKWVSLVEIKRGGAWKCDNKPQWQIDLSRFGPPDLGSDTLTERESEWLCRFEFSPLLRMVADHRELVDVSHGRFAAKDGEQHREKLSLEFLDYVEKKVAGRGDDIEEIFRKNQEYQFSIGLKATHQYLNCQHESEKSIQGEWLGMGDGGNRLYCNFSRPEQIMIGSLVSFSPAQDESAIRGLGIVKRIIMKDLKGTVQFEIERLAARVFAAGLQPMVKSPDELTVYQRALVFTQVVKGVVKHIMVVDSIAKVREGESYRFLVDSDVFPVKLIHRSNIALGCLAFGYELVVEGKKELLAKEIAIK